MTRKRVGAWKPPRMRLMTRLSAGLHGAISAHRWSPKETGRTDPKTQWSGAGLRVAQHRKRHLWRLVDHLEQRAGGSARRALALLPVAHGFDRHADAGRELRLRQ